MKLGNINQASGEYGSQYGEEFCAKCDKIIEEAKKEIEDRESQVRFYLYFSYVKDIDSFIINNCNILCSYKLLQINLKV